MHQGHHLHRISVDAGGSGGSGMGGSIGGGDRFPQWSVQETRDFLMIRAELDATFMETKRNKLLWEVTSTKMKERGYNRSAEQCKCKWKNLVTRYKGCETMEPEGMRQQFPFYNELQSIFTARMQGMLWMEAEGMASGSRKRSTTQLSSEDADENEDSDLGGDQHNLKGVMGQPKKKVAKSTMNVNPSISTSTSNAHSNNLREILGEFMKHQMQIEMEWMKSYEERRTREMEWRAKMEALENERIMMEQRWREREEQRRMREEAREEKRDALITILLNKLRREDH